MLASICGQARRTVSLKRGSLAGVRYAVPPGGVAPGTRIGLNALSATRL